MKVSRYFPEYQCRKKIDLFINGLVEVFKNEKNEVGEVLKSIFNEKFKRSKLKKKVAASTTFPLNKMSVITKIKNKLKNYYNQYFHLDCRY